MKFNVEQTCLKTVRANVQVWWNITEWYPTMSPERQAHTSISLVSSQIFIPVQGQSDLPYSIMRQIEDDIKDSLK